MLMNGKSCLIPIVIMLHPFQGLLSVQQHIEGRRVRLTKQDVITILSEENPFNYKLSQHAQEDVYAMGNIIPYAIYFEFYSYKNDNFQMKNCDVLCLFLLKT